MERGSREGRIHDQTDRCRFMGYGEPRQIEGQIKPNDHCAEMVSIFVEYPVDEVVAGHELEFQPISRTAS